MLSLVAQMSNGGTLSQQGNGGVSGNRLKDQVGTDLTVILDQLDNAFNIQSPSTGHMIDRLIAGADRGSKQGLVEKVDGQFKPLEFDLSYPMALGMIGVPPSSALISRCITIQMHPASSFDAAQLGARAIGHADTGIKLSLSKVLKALEPRFIHVAPNIPANLINRGADKWRPLLAIAEMVGGDWPERAALTQQTNWKVKLKNFQSTLLCFVMS